MTIPTDRRELLRAAVDRTLARERLTDVDVRSRFGCPAYLVDDEPFALVTPTGLCLPHLGSETRDRLAVDRRVSAFEANGSSVDSWPTVAVDPDGVAGLAPHIGESYRRARSVAADGDGGDDRSAGARSFGER